MLGLAVPIVESVAAVEERHGVVCGFLKYKMKVIGNNGQKSPVR